ncbi:MAG: EAL domain-containing protein, partial [Acidimicrobiia bacterium]|nr:EAL domain-containing protein [Acidimicrobiia bacterium]
MNPRAFAVMMTAAAAAGVSSAIVFSPMIGLLLLLAGGSLVALGAFYPDDNAPARRDASDLRNRSLVDHSPDVVTIHDEEGNVSWVSESIGQLGWSADDFSRSPIAAFVHADDRDEFREVYDRLAQQPGHMERIEVRVRRRDNSWRWIELIMVNRLSDPAIRGMVVSQRDISERRQSSDSLASRAAQQSGVAQLGRFALEGADPSSLAEAATHIISQTLEVETCELFRALDDDGLLALEAATGAAADEVDQLTLPIDSSSQAGYTMTIGEPVTSEHLRDELRFRQSRHGRAANMTSGISVVLNGRNRRYGVMVAQSCTPRSFSADDTTFLQSVANALALALERRGVEDEARHAALHDSLTELPNRVLFLDRLRMAIDQARTRGGKLGVLFIDLDHFKVINDSLGHRAGDELLRGVANQLRGTLRPGDTVARFGGDEFTILCERIPGENDAEIIADRVRTALDEPFQLEGNHVKVTASVGITVVNPSADSTVDADAVLRDADAAMYRAKDAGRSRYAMFDDSMRLRAVNRLRTESELRMALQRDELRLFYQPIVSLRTGHVVGVESLARWAHPTRGLLDPAHFIPIAEETDLIDDLTHWALTEACRQTRLWNTTGGVGTVMVTVNLSARQLERPDLISMISDVTTSERVKPSWLCLEMTETVLMRDISTSMTALWALKESGLCLAVDDFGTGYSSLAYLKRLPVDILKIDRSFVDGVGKDREDRAIVATIVNLAHTLGIVALGEGVEDHGQLNALRDLGCDLAQGFHLSVPRPPEGVDFS